MRPTDPAALWRPLPHSSSKAFRRRARPTLLAAAVAAALGSLATLPAAADTLPVGGRVVAGQASISKTAPDGLQVRQDSAAAVIDWRSFSVGKDGSVTFLQPTSRSSVLNRVTGGDPSLILGRIQANGRVFLVNPYGIVIGRDAKVDVAGLVASTANIRNADFMAGRLNFDAPGQATAQIVNEGSIDVRDGGLAAFVAPGAANRGSINARLGTVALASGAAFTLDPYGDRLIQLVVPATQLSRIVNSGTLSADGGSVQISTRSAAAVVDSLINIGGSVRARSVGEHAGCIVLEGDSHSRVAIGGTLDASGTAAGEHGGMVQVRGSDIGISAGALIDASGDAGGGSVQLGGGWHGAGSGASVATTTIQRGARIDASATQSGNGGEAVVWSDGQTRFDGQIDARGGPRGGDGGRVEVSGHRLAFDGQVDAAATLGKAGTLLLDPGSLLLQSRNSTAPAGSNDVVSTESINSQLAAGTSVALVATQDITVADRIDARLVNAAGQRLNHSGANLSLDAGTDLHLNSDVILDGGNFSATAGGRIAQAATGALLATGGGDVTLSATQGIALSSAQGVRNLALTSQHGSIELAAPITLGGRFTADVLQAAAGDRVRLDGLYASSADSTPAVLINRGAGNSGAAAVQIDDHLIAAGDISIQGAGVSLSAGKVIDTRALSGGRAGAAVTVQAGTGGIALDGGIYVDNAAVGLASQGDVTQANASVIASGGGAVSIGAAGTAKLALVQTSGALGVGGARVVLDAGTTNIAIQAGTLQLQATGSGAQAVDVRSSVALGAGTSSIASANDFGMQPATLIGIGANGTLTLDAARGITIENLQSSGAGVLIRSAHGDVIFRQALGGRAAGDTTSVTTLGGDVVPQPTLYALDVRAPEGRIETNGLLLYGLKGAPLTLDMPAAGTLAYGLNLAGSEVDVRGLVFVLEGAVSIQGRTKLVVGDSIRSAGGYAMAIGGGEIDLYRPTRADGNPYLNTDIVVAQYPDGTLKFFEQLNGVWQQSTSFLSVVMPVDLPAPGALDPVTHVPVPLPAFWLDRTHANPGIAQVSDGDAAFAVGGQVPARLLSLPNATPSGSNAFTPASGLASYDPTGQGRDPFVPLVYSVNPGVDANGNSLVGTEVLAKDGATAAAGIVDIPGTRFVPKLLITNDPGPKFTPGIVSVGGVPTTSIGRIVLSGQAYETDAHGTRLIHDITGTGFESAGDLRNLTLKVVSFDTSSLFQDSLTPVARFGNTLVLGQCSATTPGSCLDDPLYRNGDAARALPINGAVTPPFNDYPRIVYPDSATSPRCDPSTCGNGVAGSFDPNPPQPGYNPISPGFQTAGYLSRDCVASGNCARPVVTGPAGAYYATGEQPKPGANPNALTSSLVWTGASPGAQSIGRFEYFKSIQESSSFATPFLEVSSAASLVNGLGDATAIRGDIYKIGASLTQSTLVDTLGAAAPGRVTLTINQGIAAGKGVTASTDGTTAFKTALPGPSIASADSGAVPTFSTITPTLLSGAGATSTLPAATALPQARLTTEPSADSLLNSLLNDVTTTAQGQDAATGAAAQLASDPASSQAGSLLVLGGRGLAQSVDLGRSGALGTRPTTTKVDYEVACSNGKFVLRKAGDKALPPCH